MHKFFFIVYSIIGMRLSNTIWVNYFRTLFTLFAAPQISTANPPHDWTYTITYCNELLVHFGQSPSLDQKWYFKYHSVVHSYNARLSWNPRHISRVLILLVTLSHVWLQMASYSCRLYRPVAVGLTPGRWLDNRPLNAPTTVSERH